MKIKEIHYYYPKKTISNHDIEKSHPEWQVRKLFNFSGVKKRHIANNDETSLSMSVNLIKNILKKNKNFLSNIDGIIFCTQSPDYLLPSNSSVLQGTFKFRENIFTLDISHACSGFLYSLGLADSLIKNKRCKKILLINSDTYSKMLNPNDRSTKLLFSDAASLTVVDSSSNNLIDINFSNSGKHYEKLIYKYKGFNKHSNKATNKHLKMDGMGIMSFINSKLPKQINSILKKNKLNLSDIDYFFFHQASKLALDNLVKLLNIPKNKVIYDLEHGNTVSASIPIALKKTQKKNIIKKNNLILFCGFGVGLSWSTALYKY